MNGFSNTWLFRLGAAVLLAYLNGVPPASAAQMSWITVNPSRSGFVLSSGGAAFIPWGLTYSRDDRFRLIEDYWNAAGPDGWEKVERDFREMKLLGANVVRINLQFASFMEAPGRPNPNNLARLERLLGLAESLGLYLDITGLGTFRAAAVPAWYNGLTERERWAVQAEFWDAIAGAGANHPGIFAYSLMNEPLVSTEHRSPGEWTHASELHGLRYLEYINLDPAGRPATDIVRAWVRQMTAAIRKHDARHLITLGMVWIDGVEPEKIPISPSSIAPVVDFFAPHIYPATKRIDRALDSLTRYKVGRPIVVEETFPLNCTPTEYADFLRRSRTIANGWIAHFWSSPEDLKKHSDADSIKTLQSLDVFQHLNPNH
jgi:cellulase (glycosyl hydrolase family 5)